MPKSSGPNTRKTYGVRNVSSLAFSTYSINDAFAKMLEPFTAKQIAAKLKIPSWRTVESWKEGRTSPQAKHVVAMLSDDELCARLLDLANQGELARHKQTIAALKAVIAAEGK
jgi:hypothetical protein